MAGISRQRVVGGGRKGGEKEEEEKRIEEVKKEARKRVLFKRRKETRAGLIVQRRPSELDMNDDIDQADDYLNTSSIHVNNCYNNYSVVDGLWTPPASPEGDDLMMQSNDSWPPPPPTSFIPFMMSSSQQQYHQNHHQNMNNSLTMSPNHSLVSADDETDAMNKVNTIKILLFSGQNEAEAKALDSLFKLLSVYKPNEYDCVHDLIKEDKIRVKLLTLIGCSSNTVISDEDIEMDRFASLTISQKVSRGNVFNFSPPKIGFRFDTSIKDFNFGNNNNSLACLDSTIDSGLKLDSLSLGVKQDNKLICLALQAIHSIIDDGYGHVFENDLKNLSKCLVQHLESVDERINRRIVQESLYVVLVLITSSMSNKKHVLSILVDAGLIEALGKVSNVVIEDIKEARKSKIVLKDLEDMLDMIGTSILKDFVDDLDTNYKNAEEASLKERKKAEQQLNNVQSWTSSSQDNVCDDKEMVKTRIVSNLDKGKVLLILFKIFSCHRLGHKPCPDLEKVILTHLKCSKKDLESIHGPEDNFSKPQNLVVDVQIRKVKEEPEMEFDGHHSVPLKSIDSLTFFSEILSNSWPEKDLLMAIDMLKLLPTKVVIRHGLFYPLINLVASKRKDVETWNEDNPDEPPKMRNVQFESLELLLKLVIYGSNEILVLLTTDMIKDIIPVMIFIMESNKKMSRVAIRLIRKLFQRASKLNNRKDWTSSPTVADVAVRGLEEKVDIVTYARNKLESCNGPPAIWYGWYMDKDMYHEADWMSREIYPEKAFMWDIEGHDKDRAFADWDPIADLQPPIVVDASGHVHFEFRGRTMNPVSWFKFWW